jgi:nucleotide-binding universal stress UspA family protein
MFKKILVPTDGSNAASGALDKAIELSKLCGKETELIILSVYRHHSQLEASLSMVRTSDPETLDDVMREYASDIVEECKAKASKAGISKVRGFVKNGPPSRSIVSFSEEHGIDLIVIGSRGVGSIEGYLLGSVSLKVTGLAECPVMVV